MEQSVKKYWEERASQNQHQVTGTTNDIYLRELEIRTFVESLQRLGVSENSSVLDVGCGDGYTTLNVARSFPEASFTGIDYSDNMIVNANTNLKELNLENVQFKVADAVRIADFFSPAQFDFILSDRCLINLETSENQYKAIEQISSLLQPGGYYIAIENFVEGQEQLNQARKKMGLNEIPVRWHNLFFKQDEFEENLKGHFSSIEFDEFSSAYYYATRVIYSTMCKMKNEEPDYTHDIHKLAIDLPTIGQYSPIRLVILKK